MYARCRARLKLFRLAFAERSMLPLTSLPFVFATWYFAHVVLRSQRLVTAVNISVGMRISEGTGVSMSMSQEYVPSMYYKQSWYYKHGCTLAI